MSDRFGSVKYVGIIVLFFVIGFFILVPYYLGPDDLAGCGETPDNHSINTGCHQVDAIVAISGGDTSARAQEAIKLYKNGWASHLVFSGAALDKTGPSNATAMRKEAVANGVPLHAIMIEEESVNTEENAANSLALIQQQGFHRIILVTSAYHQRRASLEFDKKTVGMPLFIVNHPVRHDDQWSETWYLTPSGWWLTVSELVKVAGFYVSG
jgi:uncharacterized SAM-binding protein YcdF (DUF218 family)